MSTPVLVAVAWPYASGSRHIGHLAGAYLPADVFARHQRRVGNDVLMVSGSDVHGTPITVRAEAEGVSPQDIVDRYHGEFVEQWETLGILWDNYTTTGTDHHARVTQEMFLRQLENGHIDKRTSDQFYDTEAKRFLPDRYVEGTCPHCEYGEARGDQCDNCGRTLDATELGNPRSKISGATPELRATEHFFYRYSDFTERLAAWLKDKQGWRPHVLNFALGWTEEDGLHDRAITRDLDWGVELPVDDLGPGKRIYVWYDAVIGYLSASQEWAAQHGDAEAWRNWWENDDSRHVYFIGKDNVPFHCLFWPAQLMGAGNLHLPDDVPANQYVTFKGGKASASRGVGLTIEEALDLFQPDGLRYALAANFPEQADTDVSIEEIARRINEELVATWGNLVNRVLSMVNKNHGSQPDATGRTAEDDALLATIDGFLATCGAQIERGELRSALRTAMDGAQAVNAYLNATEPWKLAKTDPVRSGVVLATALDAINGIRVAFTPFLPFSSAVLDEALGPVDGWQRVAVEAGTPIAKPTPLFTKVDLEAIFAHDAAAT
jgi:methionyl-tRNA synthetase